MNEQQQDKILKEKLQQLQVPFDANAWAQMDAMLNKEQKKRGFIFWWLGAVGALLLIGGAALYFFINTENSFIDTNSIATSEVNIDTTEKNTTEINNSTTNINATNQPENNFNNDTKKQNDTHILNATANNIQSKEKMNCSGGNNNNNNNNAVTNSNSSRNSATAMSSRSNKKSKRNNKSETPSETENIFAAIPNNTVNNKALIPFFMASINEILFEAETMQLIDVKIAEEDKETIKAPRNKKVHYALGVSGIVAATTVGKQEHATHNFFNKPYYAVGFYHEVLFGKRISITNGIQYGKNYFEIYKPLNNTFETQPEKYACDITMLNIPVGLKMNMVAKEKFRWYVHAGINNHIKLKEHFEFLVYPPVDTTQPNPDPDPIPTNVSVQTNLNSNNDVQYESMDFSSSGGNSNRNNIATTNDFSINNAKRYYVSAYVATGVEYILKNKLHFFLEPTYQFSINPIGIQERRTRHLGVGSGIKFQF
jgi:hypothetical protein